MKKAIVPTAILCAAVCVGLHSQSGKIEEPTPTPEPPQVEVMTTPTPVPEVEIEEPIVEVVIFEPTPTPTPTVTNVPTSSQSVQAGDMVYVPGFGWFESQGEGTVTHDEIMHENGNKVGIMG